MAIRMLLLQLGQISAVPAENALSGTWKRWLQEGHSTSTGWLFSLLALAMDMRDFLTSAWETSAVGWVTTPSCSFGVMIIR